MSKVTREKCAAIIREFEPSSEAKFLGHLGIDGKSTMITCFIISVPLFANLGFTNYLLSSECDIFNPSNRSICQEMDHAMNHYFIATSHNT
jgi:hypothetical protein